MNFLKQLETIINKHSLENESNTPDFILAEYLRGCLTNYAETIKKRDKWYGVETNGISSLPVTDQTTTEMPNVKPPKRKLRAYLTGEQSKKSIEILDNVNRGGFDRLFNSLWVYLRTIVPQSVFNSSEFNSENPLRCYVEWDDGDVDPSIPEKSKTGLITCSEYHKNHNVCPKCCSFTDYRFPSRVTGYKKFKFSDGNCYSEDHSDKNDVKCKCGWTGVVHDLIPAPPMPPELSEREIP